MKKLLPLLMIVIVVGSFTSCSKKGCTDVDSLTYTESAKKDDGTCVFESELIFWYGEATSIFLIGDGATSLKFYIDGAIIGSTSVDVFWISAPNCGGASTVSYTHDLGGVKTYTATYSVVDDTGWEYYSGIINFVANSCHSLEL